jgi:CRISPR-associated protein Csm1
MGMERQRIYLAALLHDIGKFYQRADKGFSEKQNELTEYSKKMANDICPVNDAGKFGYQHVIWTNEFFEKIKAIFEAIPGLKGNIYNESNFDNIANLACNHHKPQTELQAIITLADWWSAGIDRRDPIEKAQKELNWGKTRYKDIPLYSLFNTIKEGKYQMGFMLEAFDIHKSNFPKEIKSKADGVSQEKYKILWDKFIDEFEKLPTDSINGFTESLIFLLKKYTWAIPSNTMDMANVSLFDHLKTTAAFADCIYTYYNEHPKDFNWNNSDKRLTLNEGKFPVMLVGGDISGIQKFIYNIASRKAATSLKGRSFYLQLMIDSIIQRIISHQNIDANIGHVVYSSGGKFYMLLPNTESVKKSISELSRDIEQELWKEHKGKLIFNLDYVPFAYRTNNKEIDFEGITNDDRNLGLLWKASADKLTEKKNKKFKSLLIANYQEFFEVHQTGGEVKVCAVTGIELQKGEYIKIKDSDEIVSMSVNEQIQLGNTLKDVDYLITFKGNEENSSYLSNRLKHKSNVFSVANYLYDKIELTDENADFRKITSADVSRVKSINNTNFLAAPLKGKSVSYGFQFYGGNKQAKNRRDENKTFEELTEVINSKGVEETYFGVLRMDVDGLGEIFIKGIPDNDKSFSAYATLSSYLDWFFSGYLNTIRNKYADNVNILYSGGDDVFAVGRWDLLISFAEDIREEFRKFVGREDISISAGLTIVHNKYPIAKAAELAGEAEHNAKKYGEDKAKKITAKKNAFNFLGQTVSWESEFKDVKSKKDKFISLINSYGMSRGILHRIMLFAEIQANNKRNKDQKDFVPDLSYHWNAAYYLKRYMENKDQVVQEFCKTLQIDLFVPRKMELIALAARWAELELKLKKSESGGEY